MTLPTPIAELFAAFDTHRDELIEEFFEFLRFESVSSEPRFKDDVRACCDWLVRFLRSSGMETEVWETPGLPVIFASSLAASPNAPTVLIYNHYDVQPIDPLELWTSPPFEPRVESGEVFARGAQDNKGQCFYVVAAVRYLLKKHGKLPVNLKLCIEGEEETGSAGLAGILREKASLLKSDHMFIVDLGFHHPNKPALTLGVRGIVTMTVELKGSSSDLHSGVMGGIVYNPNRALAEILGALHDERGRVTVPGFYDDVIELGADERSALSFDFDEPGFRQMFGAEANGGESAYSPLERAWVRPTLEINGIAGGYFGDGFKTVIPAKAIAKLSCRLVPNQDPHRIGEAVESFIRARAPKGIEVSLSVHPGVGTCVRSSTDGRAVRLTADVLGEACGTRCDYILSGGSIPIVAALAEVTGAEVVLMGFGLADDNIHAPNEHFGIERIRKGFVTIAAVLERLGGKS